jgi:hypothetical protein
MAFSSDPYLRSKAAAPKNSVALPAPLSPAEQRDAAPARYLQVRKVRPLTTEELKPSRLISMRPRPKYPQLANIVFLDKVGETLRQVTSDITQEELPEDIRLLLRRLERLEAKQNLKKRRDPPSG